MEGSRAKLDVSFSGLILLCIEDVFLCIFEFVFNAVLVVLSQCAPLVFAVLGTNFFHRVVGFGCFPYGGSINKDSSYTMFDDMDAGHVLLSFGFELARGLQF